jgi:hypothetical protein
MIVTASFRQWLLLEVVDNRFPCRRARSWVAQPVIQTGPKVQLDQAISDRRDRTWFNKMVYNHFSILTSTISPPNFRATQFNPYPCNGSMAHRFTVSARCLRARANLVLGIPLFSHVFKSVWMLQDSFSRSENCWDGTQVSHILNPQYHSDVFVVGIS